MPSPRRLVTRASHAGVLVALVAGLGACTSDGPSTSSSSQPPSVALGVATVAGGADLDAATLTAVETAVGDVLSGYVSRAFLGDFPRRDFVPAFESFTSRAARPAAARHIDTLTAASVQDATSVRATRLESRLSLLAVGDEVHGATAVVRFAFEATMPDGETLPVTLRGRLMLSQEQGAWSVFGYDVASDDGRVTGGAP